ncbi:MAG TPA: hypothetical protein VFV40_02070 [Nocardioides sp.]|nr:hypothetical protein [Nocardioides sp.]
MSAQKVPSRPRQVIVAGVLGVVGSVLLVLSLFDAVQRVRSVEMRSAVEDFLSEPPGDGLGVSTGWVLEVLHGMVLLNGALAAVTAVLAVYVVQRHHGARIGFSVAAALLLLTAPLSGGVMAMLVAFAATMLWGQPARDWFAGRTPVAATASARAGGEGAPPGQSWPRPGEGTRAEQAPAGPDRAWPAPEARPAASADADVEPGGPRPAAYPFGTRPDPHWAPPGVDQQPGVPAWAVGTPQDPDRRPGSVTTAVVVTWVFSGLTTLVYLLVVGMLMAARQPLVDAIQADPQFESLPMSTDDLLAVLWVMSAVSIFWSVSAFTLAVLAFRRVAWARVALVVSAAAAMLVSLLAFPFGLLHGMAAATTFALLLGKRSAAWFAHRPLTTTPPGGPGSGGYGGPGGGEPARPDPSTYPDPPDGSHEQPAPPPYQQPAPPPYQQPGKPPKPPVW